jgi:hypothetical protein
MFRNRGIELLLDVSSLTAQKGGAAMVVFR